MNNQNSVSTRRTIACGRHRAFLALAVFVSWAASAAPVVTIEPDDPMVRSCLAFGAGPGTGTPVDPDTPNEPDNQSGFLGTSPFMGFIYRDVPAFDLNPGDVLAFDLGGLNDFDVAIDIDMAPTIVNGETDQDDPGTFTKVVSNTYNPLKAFGDTTIGNFDMRFLVDSTFSFPGGGLIIRFSNGSDTYRDDNMTCEQIGVVANSNDTSGNFLLAFWADDDGVSPWGPDPDSPPIMLQEEIIGGFQIIEGPTVLLAGDILDQTAMPISSTPVGETITYSLRAQNPDATDATGVTVTATLDELVSFVSSTSTPAAIFDAGPPATLEWPIGVLAAGAETTLDIDVDVDFAAGAQTILHMAEITAADAPFVIGLVDRADITIENPISITGAMVDQSATPISTVISGEPFVYQIIATNEATIDGSGVEVTATLPEDLIFQQANATPAATTVFDAGPPATVVWMVGDVTAGDDATLAIEVAATFAAGGETLDASAVPTAPGTGDEVDTSIGVEALFTISSRTLDDSGANISSAQAGDTVNYEVTVENDSQAIATGMEVTVIPTNVLDFQQMIPSPPTTAAFDPVTPEVIRWTIGSLAAGAMTTLTLEFVVPFTANGQTVMNSAGISSSDAPVLIGEATESNINIVDTVINLLKKGSGNCFIATAAYGSFLEPEVVVLRKFRDDYLLTNAPGRSFVAWYYRHSPGFAAKIADNEFARGVVRIALSLIVYGLKFPFAGALSLLLIGFTLNRSRGSAGLSR